MFWWFFVFASASASALVGPLHKGPKLSADRTVVVVFGAIGRHNLGDLLMAEVTTALLQSECGISDVVFADVFGQDMRLYGGRDVSSIVDLMDQPAKLDVIMAGGETLGVTAGFAAHMILADWPRRPKLPAKFQDFSSHGYVMVKSLFKNPGVFVANTIGGPEGKAEDALAKLDFVSFRDKKHGKLPRAVVAPDSVVMIRRVARPSGFGGKRFVAVQFALNKLGKSNHAVLASQLVTLARSHALDIVFFRAGAAERHDSLDPYYAVVKMMSDKDPTVVAQVYTDLNIWNLVSLIAHAQLVLSTSLHVRIVAAAYSRPRLSLCATTLTKYKAFVDAWEDPPLPFVKENAARADVTTLATVAGRALKEPWFKDVKVADRLERLYMERVFRVYSPLLSSRDNRCSSSS